MNFDQLKAFHRVALTGSFTRAAKSLHITQPAVSQQIQLLEHSLGIRLFDRHGKKVRLTVDGEALLGYVGRLFNIYDEIKNLFESRQRLESGKISIGSSNVMGTYYLPQIIRLYNEQYPGIELDLRLGNSNYVLDKVLEGEVEIGIAGKMANNAKLVEHIIHRERLLLVSSPEHDLSKKPLVRLEDLVKASFISREKGTLNRAVVEQWFQDNFGKGYPRISIELENVEAAKQIVRQGYGITVIPEVTVKREIETGLLKQLNYRELELHSDIYVIYLKNKVFSRAVKIFLQTLSNSGIFSNTETLIERVFTQDPTGVR